VDLPILIIPVRLPVFLKLFTSNATNVRHSRCEAALRFRDSSPNKFPGSSPSSSSVSSKFRRLVRHDAILRGYSGKVEILLDRTCSVNIGFLSPARRTRRQVYFGVYRRGSLDHRLGYGHQDPSEERQLVPHARTPKTSIQRSRTKSLRQSEAPLSATSAVGKIHRPFLTLSSIEERERVRCFYDEELPMENASRVRRCPQRLGQLVSSL